LGCWGSSFTLFSKPTDKAKKVSETCLKFRVIQIGRYMGHEQLGRSLVKLSGEMIGVRQVQLDRCVRHELYDRSIVADADQYGPSAASIDVVLHSREHIAG
jgi:hypothetical protein